jgi:hypothetical protein
LVFVAGDQDPAMRVQKSLLIIAIAWLVSCCGGCQSVSSGPPFDPVLVSKKPILGHPNLTASAGVACVEPHVPAEPLQAVAGQPLPGPANADVIPVALLVRGQAP